MAYEGMIAETLSIAGDNGELISAYVARPPGPGPYPGMLLFHHAPIAAAEIEESARSKI